MTSHVAGHTTSLLVQVDADVWPKHMLTRFPMKLLFHMLSSKVCWIFKVKKWPTAFYISLAGRHCARFQLAPKPQTSSHVALQFELNPTHFPIYSISSRINLSAILTIIHHCFVCVTLPSSLIRDFLWTHACILWAFVLVFGCVTINLIKENAVVL